MSKFEKVLGLNEELLKELLGQMYESEILEVFDKHLETQSLLVFTFKDIEKPLKKENIDTLANKYKKFVAKNSDISLGSYYNKKLKQWQSIVIPDELPKGCIEPRFEADTEPKAIIQTYQYFREENKAS